MTFPVDETKSDESKTIARPIVYTSWFLRTIPKVIASQRYLAYASEVGESFRPIIRKYMVNFSYTASLIYVASDIGINTYDMFQAKKPQNEIALKTTDLMIWHGFASMILPALTIHSIVKYSGKGIDKFNVFNSHSKLKTWSPTLIALMCIPFIIHPIDHVTDFAMDNSIRKLYKMDQTIKEVENETHE